MSAAPSPESTVPAGVVLAESTVPGGWTWSAVLRRGTALRVVDVEGGGNVALTALRASDPAERYAMGDTLKQEFVSRLTAGHALFSEMGRILLSIVRDDVGGHDPFGGLSDDRLLARRHGAGGASYQDLRNDRWRSGRAALETELAKHGLDRRDLGDVVNLFSVVDVAEDGTTALRAGHSPAGSCVVLRAELDVLVAVYVGPHPHAGVEGAPWAPRPARLIVETADAPGPHDPVRTLRPENERGLAASELAAALGPAAR
ncbi:urea amidolyase associated protein UAAP1 [Patulibacter sp. S7RM1-6]